MKEAPKLKKDQIILVNLSGRGDKDVNEAARFLLSEESTGKDLKKTGVRTS